MTAWHPDWPGFSARGSLLLPLEDAAFADLVERMHVDGVGLQRKGEFHVTLLDRALGARAGDSGAAAARLPALFSGLDWRWRATGERWLLREVQPAGCRYSVVELLEMPAFAAFRRGVGDLLGEALPAAPAHVTLYVAGDPLGVGLASQAQFERLRLRRLN
jgi:hypothetical protein